VWAVIGAAWILSPHFDELGVLRFIWIRTATKNQVSAYGKKPGFQVQSIRLWL